MGIFWEVLEGIIGKILSILGSGLSVSIIGKIVGIAEENNAQLY